MMSAKDREDSVKVATRVECGDVEYSDTVRTLARGLLAERSEVLAGRAKIADMAREAQASAERFVEQERRHVADLAAARGVTSRLREALLLGATDAVQAESLTAAVDIAAGGVRVTPQVYDLARGFIALSEEHRSLRAHYLATLDGIKGVLDRARAAK